MSLPGSAVGHVQLGGWLDVALILLILIFAGVSVLLLRQARYYRGNPALHVACGTSIANREKIEDLEVALTDCQNQLDGYRQAWSVLSPVFQEKSPHHRLHSLPGGKVPGA